MINFGVVWLNNGWCRCLWLNDCIVIWNPAINLVSDSDHHTKKLARMVRLSSSYYLFTVFWDSAKTLAVDLLYDNPNKHKLKLLVQTPRSYFMDVKCSGMWIYEQYCNLKSNDSFSFFFFLFRLLQHHDRLLARTNSSCLRFVLECAVPTYRRKSKADRGCVTFPIFILPINLIPLSQVAHSAERTDFLILQSWTTKVDNFKDWVLVFYRKPSETVRIELYHIDRQ